jgi:nucleoid-associated protein YgaU
LKPLCRLQLLCFLLIVLTACAAPVARFKTESELTLERVRVSRMEALFPAETLDFYRTVHQGDLAFTQGALEEADLFYSLAIGKGRILEELYQKELERKEAAARLEFERQREAEAELERQRALEREHAAEQAREALAQAKRLEAEKAESRKRAERARHEKEVQPVSRHTVKRGETLPQIAALPEVYGDSSLWPLIYRSNRDQISNPAVLWPGQVLRIPRNVDRNDINEARRFAGDRSLR